MEITGLGKYYFLVSGDAAGNIFIADHGNHRIRMINTSGTIATVVGNGTAAFGGDGGPPINAKVNYPKAVYHDLSGDMYIVDAGNYRIRKVTASTTNINSSGKVLNLIKAYPNPTKDVLFFELIMNSQIIVTDLLGKVLLNVNKPSGEQSISLRDLATGTYIVKVINDENQSVIKIIKE